MTDYEHLLLPGFEEHASSLYTETVEFTRVLSAYSTPNVTRRAFCKTVLRVMAYCCISSLRFRLSVVISVDVLTLAIGLQCNMIT